MAKVLVDTNFILGCVRNKLDFYEELLHKGHSVLIPKQVLLEIERIKNSSKSLKLKDEANLALKIIKSGDYEEVDCPGRYVDVGIKSYLKEKSGVVLGTMDKDLKKSVKNRKMVIRNKKKLELQ